MGKGKPRWPKRKGKRVHPSTVPKAKKVATGIGTTQKRFTDYFKLGDSVSIIRTEHGWHDGRLQGTVKVVQPYGCVVSTDQGDYFIEKVRDIYKNI